MTIPLLNREALEERFGGWPSFHDAEVLAVRFDNGQRSDADPSVELDIHVFAVDGLLDERRLNFVLHTVVTLRFEEVEEIELDGFGPQNVLDGLVLTDLGERLGVRLPSNNGLGGRFLCRRAGVTSVAAYEPGPRSVYHDAGGSRA